MNRKTVIIFVLLCFTFFSFSQEKKWSLEAHYPFPVDDNFVGKNYNGIIDLGAKYRFLEANFLRVGAGLNGGILKGENQMQNWESVNFEFNVMVYYIQPKVFAEFNIAKAPEFHPFVYAGYNFMIFSANPSSGYDVSSETETQSGFNIGAGFSYDINDTFFAQIQYDFTKINLENGIPDITYNTNVNLIKIGVGMRF